MNKLTLSNDRLTDISALTLSLKRTSSITSLDLSSNYLDRSQASHIADMLLSNCTMEYLNLSSNVFGDHGAQLLALALEQNVALKTLKLENCSLLDLGVSSLGKALKYNCTLTHLSLAGNAVSDLACHSFVESLGLHRNESLLELLVDGPTAHMMESLNNLLLRNDFVRKGEASDFFPENPKPGQQGVLTVPTLGQSTFVGRTDLHWNVRYPLTLKTMVELFTNAKLSTLNLSCCGLSQLSPAIGSMSTLKFLDLRSNNLTSICAELANCKLLEILKLSDNLLESIPCELSQLSALSELHLYGNPLTYIPDSINRIDGLLDGPQLDASFVGMNVYRYHHVNFQQSLLIQYLRTMFQSQTSETEFMYGGLAVVGPEKSGKTAFLNALASQCNKRFKQWDVKYGPLVTVFNPGQSVSPNYEEASNPEAIFDAPTPAGHTLCAKVNDFMLIHDDNAKKTPTWYHLVATDYSGAASHRLLPTYLLGESQTLYLVVFNLLEFPAKQGSIDGWIRSIQTRAGAGASIILIGTHAETKFAANKNAARDMLVTLKKQYPQVADVHFLDLKAKPEKVLKALTPIWNSLVTVGRAKSGWAGKVPMSYIYAVSQVLHLRDQLNLQVVPLDVFIENLCCAGALPSNVDAIIDKLASIGMIKVFRKDHKLKQAVFLDTTFLHQALSEITSASIASKVPTGTVGRKTLDTLWSPLTKPRMRAPVLKLLENFELVAIDYARLEESLTIPHLLPTEPNALSSYWNPQIQAQPGLGTKLFERHWDLPFAPFGVGPKLVGSALSLPYLEIVSKWASGLVVRYGEELGKLEFHADTSAISVQVVSVPTAFQLCPILFRIVTQFIQVWFTAHHEIKISVPVPLKNGASAKVPFSEIIDASLAKKTSITVSGESVDLADLAPDLIRVGTHFLPGPVESKSQIAKGELGISYKGHCEAFVSASKDETAQKATTDAKSPNVFIKEATNISDLADGNPEASVIMLEALKSLTEGVDLGRLSQLCTVAHPNLVSFSALSCTPHWSSCAPYVESVNLSTFVTGALETSLELKLKLLLDVAFAVEHLHRQSPLIVHGNVRPSNVIIQQKDDLDLGLVAKTTDYGLWPEMITKSLGQLKSTNWQWQAPEVFIGGAMTPKSDSYSFGMLVWYVWVCHVKAESEKQKLGEIERRIRVAPYFEYMPDYPQNTDLQHAIYRRQLRPSLPNDNRMLPGFATLELLIRACWKPNPDERPDFGSIIKKLLSVQEHVRDAVSSSSGETGKAPKARSVFSVNMKQLQHSRSWQLLASYVFKQQPHLFTSAISVGFKIPPTQVAPVSSRPASLIPAPLTALSFLASSTLWLGSSKNFVVLVDLKDGKTSFDLKLDSEKAERPTISIVTSVYDPKKIIGRSDSRGKARAAPPPMLIQTTGLPSPGTSFGSNSFNQALSSPGSTSPPMPSSPGTPPARIGSPPGSGLLSTGSSGSIAVPKAAPQRIIGSFVSGVAIWSFCEDKTLTISLGPKAMSKVEIGHHPICVTKNGDFGYVGCGEGCILELDLTRQPDPSAISIDAYLTRILDVQGHPVYSMHVDDTNVWVGTKGEALILDRLSSHRYFSWVAHTDRIVSILKMPDGKSVWTASDDRSIKVWPIRTVSQSGAVEVSSPQTPDKTLLHHTQRIKDMILCGNHVVSIAGENSAVWDTVTGTVVKVLPHSGYANAIAVLDSSTIVTISSTYDQATALHDSYIQLWTNGLDNPPGAETASSSSSPPMPRAL